LESVCFYKGGEERVSSLLHVVFAAICADQDMAGRSRAKAAAIQILKTAELEAKDCKRPIVKQFHSSTIKFPLPHRVVKTPKEFKTTFKASRPNTYF